MLCWKTGTGMVTVAGVGAGVAVGVDVGVGAAAGVVPAEGKGDVVVPPEGDERNPALTSLMISAPAVRLRTAPARTTPPTARNCRLVATADLMVTIFAAPTFRKDDAYRHGIARCGGRP